MALVYEWLINEGSGQSIVDHVGGINLTPEDYVITGDISTGSDVVQNVSDMADVQIGGSISGIGIPVDTTIIDFDVNNSTITMSNNATATTVTLSITITHIVKWGTDYIFGQERTIVRIGYRGSHLYNSNDGFLVNSTGISALNDSFTLAWVGNPVIKLSNGAVFNIGNTLIRTWGDNVDRSGVDTLIAEADLRRGQWSFFFIVCDGVNAYTYVNGNLVSTNSAFNLNAGTLRVLSYSADSAPGSMDLEKVSIYDHAMSESDRNTYMAQYGSIPSTYSFSKFTNNDLGGFLEWIEEGSKVYPKDDGGENAFYHVFDGTTCQGALCKSIPPNLDTIFIEGKFKYPTTFDANHAIGSSFLTVALWHDRPIPGDTHDLVRVLLQHDLATDVLTLADLTYRNTSGQTSVSLDDTVITKDVYHKFKLKVDFVAGTIDLWYDDVSKLSLTGLTLDLDAVFAYWGPFLGAHPEGTGNFFWSKDYHIGEIDYSAGIKGNKIGGLLSRERLVV